jgi:hypothetical protein
MIRRKTLLTGAVLAATAGAWRDIADDSPHGHAAFLVTVP